VAGHCHKGASSALSDVVMARKCVFSEMIVPVGQFALAFWGWIGVLEGGYGSVGFLGGSRGRTLP